VIFTTTHLSVYAVGYNKVSFTDVKQTDYFYAPVTYLGARGAITGAAFEPKRAITRGEAIVMIMKAYGIKPMEDPTDIFSMRQANMQATMRRPKQ
jgi:endo-1,4-beta-xylanase